MPKTKRQKRSHTDRPKPSKQAKHRRRALQMLRKSVEYQVRLAYARIPVAAQELTTMRLRTREELVAHGYLRIEGLESLSRTEAIAQAMKRLNRQVPAKERQRL